MDGSEIKNEYHPIGLLLFCASLFLLIYYIARRFVDVRRLLHAYSVEFKYEFSSNRPLIILGFFGLSSILAIFLPQIFHPLFQTSPWELIQNPSHSLNNLLKFHLF